MDTEISIGLQTRLLGFIHRKTHDTDVQLSGVSTSLSYMPLYATCTSTVTLQYPPIQLLQHNESAIDKVHHATMHQLTTLVAASDKLRSVHRQFCTSRELGCTRCIANAGMPPAYTNTILRLIQPLLLLLFLLPFSCRVPTG